MALNLRLPPDLDRQLDDLAAQEHVSKHALLLQGAELLVNSRIRRRQIDDAVDFVLGHDAELMRRLADS